MNPVSDTKPSFLWVTSTLFTFSQNWNLLSTREPKNPSQSFSPAPKNVSCEELKPGHSYLGRNIQPVTQEQRWRGIIQGGREREKKIYSRRRRKYWLHRKERKGSWSERVDKSNRTRAAAASCQWDWIFRQKWIHLCCNRRKTLQRRRGDGGRQKESVWERSILEMTFISVKICWRIISIVFGQFNQWYN